MKKILVIGGAGFIGSNVVGKFLDEGNQLIIYDNLSRKGTDVNLRWLREQGHFEFIQGDIRNFIDLISVFKKHPDIDVVFHLAAQVAVTTSVINPREDFEINALGSFNVLEAVRSTGCDPIMIYASTNKVYGGLEDVAVVEKDTRYAFDDYVDGIPESCVLDFHSPYGCSKGVGDQYFRDYHRIYGLRTVVCRQSCIYGYHQFGLEDQGWVAWFIIASLLGKPLTVYGDGKQVRDILFIDDLVDAYVQIINNIDKAEGKIFNIGGGPKNTISVWAEFAPLLNELIARKIDPSWSDWRRGDQKVYISNISKIEKELGWQPVTAPREGITKLFNWVSENKEIIRSLFE